MIPWGGSDGSDPRLRKEESAEPAAEVRSPGENQPHSTELVMWVCAVVGVYRWLRQVREGRMPGLSLNKPAAAATFAPVSIVPDGSESRQGKPVPTPSLPAPEPSSAAAPTSKRRNGAVEIRLANGRIIKVDESIEAQALARLLAVVDGDRS